MCALVLVWGTATPLAAQATSAAAQSPPANDPKWEIEVHAGGAFGKTPTGGTPIGAFPVGEAFTAPLSGRPSRFASTWYFGDGATLLNQIAEGFLVIPVTRRITPLDPVLTRSSLARKRDPALGVRVSRRLTARWSAEFSVDSHKETFDFTEAAVNGIEATRASFGPVWDGIFATGGGFLFANGATSSTTALADGSGRRTMLTGAANFALSSRTRLVPYVTAGGGVSIRTGDLPTATLTGNYQFRFTGVAPFNESDVMTVHFTARDKVAVGVVGGGVKYALSPRQGLRIDARVHISPHAIDTLVDARPSAVPGTPAFFIPSTTTPALVFSNTPTQRSNLTGPPIADLKTFTGTGRDIQSSLTVGYFLRFPAAVVPAAASARSPRTPPVLTGHKWELEAHAGGAFGNQPTAGTAIGTFPPGESFTTLFIPRPSRYASTWYFGDGAVLINQIAAGFTGSGAATTSVTPLDPVLTAAILERRRGPGLGVRLSRRLTARISGELGVDSIAGSFRMTRSALDRIEATRASFTPMWNALIATGSAIFLSPSVTSTSTLRERADSRQTLVTGAVNVGLPGKGRVMPYVTAGGGVIVRSGSLPTATLTGNYQFRFVGQAPFNQSDVVTVRFAAKDKAPVGLFGGGVKYAVSPRQGLRADVRVHIHSNSLDTLVDARPESVPGTPAFSISSTTTPSLVFSNTPATRANLTGPAIVGLKTFTGSGRDLQTMVTVGYFVRF